MPIPFFVKLPHQTSGAIDDRNVENIDVLPTILDLLKITPSVDCDGHSVLDKDFVARPKKRFLTGGKLAEVDADFAARFQSLHPSLLRFRRDASQDAVFCTGLHDDLVGRRLSELEIRGRSNAQITLTNWKKTYTDDPRDLVPSYIEGRVHALAEADQPIHLAIVIDDTVRAVTRSYQMRGIEDVWSAIVPEQSFRTGDNVLRVLEVRTIEGTRTMWECELTGGSK